LSKAKSCHRFYLEIFQISDFCEEERSDGMGKIISVHSFRGGTGKSNISANVAAQLASQGNRVGVVDTDIQSPGIHVLFGMDDTTINMALNDYLWERCAVEDAAYDVTASVQGEGKPLSGKLYLIPSSLRSGEISKILKEGYDVTLMTDGLDALVEKLDLDYLIIDTHPGVNEETLLSLALSDALVIVLRPDQQDFQGTAVVVDLARKLKVPNLFLVINMALSSYSFDALRELIEGTYDCPVAAIIPLSEDVAREQSSNIFTLRHPVHPVTQAIKEITKHIEVSE
jgi:MinD-like ATPase involved in chromosome partitioning or flagellar assembly